MDAKDPFNIAVGNVPKCDIKLIRNQVLTTNPALANNELRIREVIVNNRWCNKICDTCLNKRDPDKLMHCGRCCLTFYCNRECQRKDWDRHKLRCCKPDGPLDKGPQELVFVNVK